MAEDPVVIVGMGMQNLYYSHVDAYEQLQRAASLVVSHPHMISGLCLSNKDPALVAFLARGSILTASIIQKETVPVL